RSQTITHTPPHHPHLRSFPTRRSSDLYGYPSYYGGYYRSYYGGYGGYYGYRFARRPSSIVLARAKKNSAIALATLKMRRVHGTAFASSTATSPRAHPPKRIQGRFATVAAR